jgi:hypothetical protein
MIEPLEAIEAPSASANAICLRVCATDWDALVRQYTKAECHVSRIQSAPRKLSAGEAALNSAQAARLQQRRFEPVENRAVQRMLDEVIGLLDRDPGRVAPAVLPTQPWPKGPVVIVPAITGVGGRYVKPEGRDVAKSTAPLQFQPLWFKFPKTWRRQNWTITLAGREYDKRTPAKCIRDTRQAERDVASATLFPSGVVLTREMFIAELAPAYALLWPWPSGGNETEGGVLDYTILRLLDWTPDAAPATTLARAFDAAGWSRAPYARKFENRRHLANWINARARHYAKSLGRCRALVPAMRDDIPVLFSEKMSKVTLPGKKLKVAIPALLSDRVLATDPTIDVWDSIAKSKPERGDRFVGLPSRTTGGAVPANHRVSPSKPLITEGGEVAGRQTLSERYGENIPQWQLKMIDRALDDMELERQHREARNVAVDGRPTSDAAVNGFERNDGSDTHGTVGRSSSGTRKARGAAAAQAVVEMVHNEITFHEWLDTLDVEDDFESIRVIALTLCHWGNGEPHEDLARMIGLDPEAVRGRLALAFEGLRRAIGYEPSRRGRVEDGIKKLAIRAETLGHVAIQMTFEAEILAPTKSGGRPRKLDARVAAERMSQAAQLLEILELDERLFLLLDGVAVAPSEMFGQRPRGFREVSGASLQLMAERIAEYACVASALDPANGFRPATIASPAVCGTLGKPSIWEVLDALGDAGLLKDRAFRGRPGGAARLAVSLAGATAYRGVDVEKLLQEYIDREPRPPALAKPVPASDRPSAPVDEIAIRRHAADVRALPWRLPSWHANEPGMVGLRASDREDRYFIHDRRLAPAEPEVAP